MTSLHALTPLELGELACNSLIQTFSAEDLPPKGIFHYHQGVFLLGMELCYLQDKNKDYDDYIRQWVNSIIDTDGKPSHCDTGSFDDLQPCILLYRLADSCDDPRYEKALHRLIPFIKEWPTNDQGGFWHKGHLPNQMWLDSLFMSGPISVRYGRYYNKPEYFDLIAHQALLMHKCMRDFTSGLMYHGWDASKSEPWADPQTGLSSQFWGRALGWVPVALVEILDDFPLDHPKRIPLILMLQDILKSLVPFQDPRSGLWHQVLDRTHDPDNWLESSCSCLFTYAFAKAVRKGYLHPVYLTYALKAYTGLVDRLHQNEDGLLQIEDICIGTGIGDYKHYLDRPRSTNDLHGAGAFIMMCSEVNQINEKSWQKSYSLNA